MTFLQACQMVLPGVALALRMCSLFDHIQCKRDLKIFITWHVEKFKGDDTVCILNPGDQEGSFLGSQTSPR